MLSAYIHGEYNSTVADLCRIPSANASSHKITGGNITIITNTMLDEYE